MDENKKDETTQNERPLPDGSTEQLEPFRKRPDGSEKEQLEPFRKRPDGSEKE